MGSVIEGFLELYQKIVEMKRIFDLEKLFRDRSINKKMFKFFELLVVLISISSNNRLHDRLANCVWHTFVSFLFFSYTNLGWLFLSKTQGLLQHHV